MPKPVLVFAPGGWHPSNTYDPITTLLTADGYECHPIAFPSVYRATEIKDKSLETDIAAIREIVEPVVEAGRDVVLVVHSWAGFPCNSGLTGLTKNERAQQGEDGGVGHLFFISAFLPKVGQSVAGIVGLPSWTAIDEESATILPKDPIHRFYHDIPESEAQKWATTLQPHALATKLAPATAAAYLSVPSTYVLCTQDNALPLAVQEEMVASAKRDGAEMQCVVMETSHSPWMLKAGIVADLVKGALSVH